ncbi:MAG: DUF3048 domain-containing protein [Anaerolineae bacterium]|jgi:hypothetical protein|nr:DUF3048 domain-containing protein [Anaerolineae bacterium]MBT7072870.1 DUF3048 domain-containing protein [Anaerolineae bacterium]MBT7326299.1 DUF3048 domain-containing protein [Anaerolineae bacterium]
MSEKKITLSIKYLKFFGGLVFFTFLVFLVFAINEGRSAAQASENTDHFLSVMASPTPFLPGGELDVFPFEDVIETAASPTPRPTVVYEDGQYPTAIPLALPTLSNITPYSLPEGINPLTGKAPMLPEFLDRRPVASKITLYPRSARPQSALTMADVVFEYYIEGGLTRFIAVFYGTNPTQIGPVRSGRFFDEHIMHMYQSYLVFKFADPRVLDYLKATDVSEFLALPTIASCPPYFVGKEDRDTYNNIYFDLTRFGACLEKKELDNSRPTLRAGYFSGSPPAFAEEALRIFTYYSVDDYHYWGYEPLNQRYYRQQEITDTRDGKLPSYAPLIDMLTGQQVSADNIVFLFVPHSFTDQFQEEDEVYHIDPIGSGKAYLFRDGVVLPAYWRRIAIDQPLLITDLNGMPLSLKPGRTFYEVLKEDSTATQDEVQWYFQFEP